MVVKVKVIVKIKKLIIKSNFDLLFYQNFNNQGFNGAIISSDLKIDFFRAF